ACGLPPVAGQVSVEASPVEYHEVAPAKPGFYRASRFGRPHGLPLKSLVLFVPRQYIPDAFGQLFAYHSSGYRATASAFNFTIKFLDDFVMGVGRNGCLTKGRSPREFGVAVFVA